MPELPEVETIVRQLRARGVEGRSIERAEVSWERTVEPLSAGVFCDAIRGTVIERIGRTGKWMQFELSSGQSILIHLRMAGSFSLIPTTHDRIVLHLSDGLTLHYCDTRKFGRWKLVDDAQSVLGALGPDALTEFFTLSGFRKALAQRKRAIKAVILDQSIVAGLGNIYADEALWAACIHPERPARSLSAKEEERLFLAIRSVLQVGVENRGTSLGVGKTNYKDLDGESGKHREEVKAYGRFGQPCERCGTRMERRVVAQRGTTMCPKCQRASGI